MPMFPDQEQVNAILDKCIKIFESGEKQDAIEISERLMNLPCVPMHSPCHHFLVVAALLTHTCLRLGKSEEDLKNMLQKAKERSEYLPGGMCGQSGCCGAAVSAGIFASVFFGTSPTSKKHWADGMKVTAAALEAISSCEGPRCCKRDSYFAIDAALKKMSELLGDHLECNQSIRCTHSASNRECKGIECPFFHQS